MAYYNPTYQSRVSESMREDQSGPDSGHQRPDSPVRGAPEVEEAGHVQARARAHRQVAVQTRQLLGVLDQGDPGVQDLLHVLV